MTEKHYITAQQLLEGSFVLADKIYQDEFYPDFIVALWRGGTPVGITIQEYFEYRNQPCDHIAVRTSSYYGIGQQDKEIRVHGLHYLIENMNRTDKLLIVDDIFDTGRSIQALVEQLKDQMRENFPTDIGYAMPYFKPQNNVTDIVPDYWNYQTDSWLVFPHEIVGLTIDEIEENKQDIDGIINLLR